jgi:hypothetical protein
MTDAEWIDQACVLIGEAAGELERPRKGLAQVKGEVEQIIRKIDE